MKKFISIIVVATLVIFGFMVHSVKANGSAFVVPSSTTATSSVVYMTPGTATTTYYFDSQIGTNQAVDSAVLQTQFTGSSTASSVNIALEYSHGVAGTDCTATPTACDWYQDRLSAGATTTQTISLNQATTYTLSMSSTTPGGVAGNSSRTFRVMKIDFPTRYVRAVYTMPAGSQNGAIWGGFVGKREVTN